MTIPLSESVRIAQALYAEYDRREAKGNPWRRSVRFDQQPAPQQRWWIDRAERLRSNPRGFAKWEREIAREATTKRK